MKILQLTFALSSGGAERFVVDLSNELCKRENTEIVLLMVVDKSIKGATHYLPNLDKRVKFISAGCKSGYHWKSFIRVFNIIRHEKPDLVHAHCGSLLLFLPALLLKNTKYVHTLHNLAEKCLNNHAQYVLNKFFYKKIIKPVTISKQCELSYEKLYGNGTSIQIANGRSPIVASPKLEDIKKEIKSLGIRDTDKIYIHVARADKQKNQQLLFESFRSIVSKHPNMHLIVLGQGYSDTNLMNYNGRWNIHILGEKNNVEDYMLCSHFFILSSLFEGLPISILEALSCGLIVVSTPAGGVPDVIKDGFNGFLSPSYTQNDFESTILRALSEETAISRKDIIKDYTEKYSMTTCAKKYYEVFEGLK